MNLNPSFPSKHVYLPSSRAERGAASLSWICLVWLGTKWCLFPDRFASLFRIFGTESFVGSALQKGQCAWICTMICQTSNKFLKNNVQVMCVRERERKLTFGLVTDWVDALLSFSMHTKMMYFSVLCVHIIPIWCHCTCII